MAIMDLFSKRQRRERGELPDVYQYDKIPSHLRVQIIQILKETLGNEKEYYDKYKKVRPTYNFIVNALRREYGVFNLYKIYSDQNKVNELFDFILKEVDAEKVLDAVELSFKGIDLMTRGYDYRDINSAKASSMADSAIEELNHRFNESGVGYQYEKGMIVRIDSTYTHSEIVKPTLDLLRGEDYSGVNDEFLRAHEHYRNGNYKEALNETLKALESTLKVICNNKGWSCDEKDTVKKLLDVCFEKELIPGFWQSHFSSLRSTLESGVPTARNRLGGHGQGAQRTEVPSYIASYCINLTASAILLLVQAAED